MQGGALSDHDNILVVNLPTMPITIEKVEI